MTTITPSGSQTVKSAGIRPILLAGVLAIVAAVLTPAVMVAAAAPEPPRLYVDTSATPSSGQTIAVPEGGNFQAALDAARPGDTITLAAGAAFTGNFRLPNKGGAGWIVIRTSAPDSRLPSPGTRLTPAAAKALPKIVSPNSSAAIATDDGAHHYRLIGIEITVDDAVASSTGLVQLGNGTQTTRAEIAHDIVLDRVYIHGNERVRLRRAVALNSAATAIVDSHLSGAHDPEYGAQAIAGWNGPGPFKIVNNYLEGSGENVLFGGADPTVGDLVPSDIEIRRNHFSKPLSWRVGDPGHSGAHWAVKHLLELKNAQRVLIDGNVFENTWADAGNGFAILFTVRNQDGRAPWSVVQDVMFANNIVRRAGGGIAILGKDTNHASAPVSRVWIRNNLFEGIDASRWGGLGRLFQIVNGAVDVVIEHTTGVQSGSLIGADLDPSRGFVYRNNIAPDNGYGVVGAGDPRLTLATFLPGAIVVGNVIPVADPADYPDGNVFPASLADIGFADLAAGDYRLAATSPYRATGTDGKDPGVDHGALFAATAGVTDTTPPPGPVLAGAAVLPISRAGRVGATITVFGIVIAGPAAAVGCSIAPITSIPASFSYRTTDPATNQATGTPDAPVDIAAGGLQTFVIAFTPTAPFPATLVQLSFDCANTPPAAIIAGVNTLLLSASSVAVPDMVVLAATPTGDGIVTTAGQAGTGFFSLATVNVGADALITASTDTGGAAMAVSLAMCQTNATTGQCISPVGRTVTTRIGAGETSTFSVFVSAHGGVAFDPRVNRVFVRFTAGSGETAGATSIAVRTH